MFCRKCQVHLERSEEECTLTRVIYRCPSCTRRYQCNSTTGDLVELSATAGAFGILISVALALFGIGIGS